MSLDYGDFCNFFSELWSTPEQTIEPFPWQRALAKQVIDGAGWPRNLKMPTGAGKTASLDIAVFHLASQAPASMDQRSAALRIFYVIDRRIVVDQAYERARQLAQRLEQSLTNRDARNSVVREVASRLCELGDQDAPLEVSRMRGGIYREDVWAQAPDQPTVCISTVDQVGSRVLFRGYGVSDSMKPVHAGLVGTDALFITDEAHLSKPFAHTLERIRTYQGSRWSEVPTAAPFTVVEMSATISADDETWRDQKTRRLDAEHPVLGPRLSASKNTSLDKIKPSGDIEAQRRVLADKIAQHAVDILDADTAPTVIGVVVNRVRTARRVFSQLHERHGDDGVALLTGRTRAFDRDRLLGTWHSRIRAGRDRNNEVDQPLFVVATQTIEVGADLDFDAMITELAALDALRQRFGRVDRFGELGESRSVIVALHEYTLVKGSEKEPIYGSSLRATWKWLKNHEQSGVVDMGISGIDLPGDPQELLEMCAPRKNAPSLLPAHLDILAQTSPRPAPDIDVSVFLHGVDSQAADVQVVWRADLDASVMHDESTCINIVNAMPPTSQEALRLPIGTAKGWLNKATVDAADIEGVELTAEANAGAETDSRRCVLRWQGPDDSELIPVSKIRPGDTLIIPSDWGGADKFGFDPKSTEAVRDVAEATRFLARKRPVLRLHPTVLKQSEVGEELIEQIDDALPRAGADELPERRAVIQALQALSNENCSIGAIAHFMYDFMCDAPDDVKLVEYPNSVRGSVPVLVSARTRPTKEAIKVFSETGTLPAGAKGTGENVGQYSDSPVALGKHLEDTRRLARGFANQLLDNPTVERSIEIAAQLHDIGKADPRFQAWLHGGDKIAAAAAGEPLAKSGMNPRDRQGWKTARQRAGFPDGYRHECLSAVMIESAELSAETADIDLVVYLVGAHHGRGRPFFPMNAGDGDAESSTARVVIDDVTYEHSTAHRLSHLESEWPARFRRLIQKYGWWGLCCIETLVRLADHKASRQTEELDEF